MLPRIFAKFRSVFLGIVIGFGLACAAVLWTNQGRYMNEMTRMSFDAYPHPNPNLGKIPHLDVRTWPPDEKNIHQENTHAKQQEIKAASVGETEPEQDLVEAYGHVRTILFFIGYPRSRHSLLGSLLDAHPHMIISDEAMGFQKWRGQRQQWTTGSIYTFYDSLFGASQRAVTHGRRSRVFEGSVANKTAHYSYSVPNQWQGKFDRYIEVIGDKSGAFTAGAMMKDDAVESVHLLEKVSVAKVKFVHVIRNPFDNLATMTLEEASVRKRDGEHKTKINASKVLDAQINRYFYWAAGCKKAREAFPHDVIDVPSMEIVKRPAETLRKICAFLEITCSEDYIQDCAKTVDSVPSITRDFVVWTDKQKESVYEKMKQFSFFDGYTYDQ